MEGIVAGETPALSELRNATKPVLAALRDHHKFLEDLLARASGIRSGRLMFSYAARNALLPVVTVVGLQLGAQLQPGHQLILQQSEVALLAQLAFGEALRSGDIPRLGIEWLQPEDLAAADAAGNTKRLSIDQEKDIATARLEAWSEAVRIGLSKFTSVKVATAVSELARNIIFYAGRGAVGLRGTHDDRGARRQIVGSDQGPGVESKRRPDERDERAHEKPGRNDEHE